MWITHGYFFKRRPWFNWIWSPKSLILPKLRRYPTLLNQCGKVQRPVAISKIEDTWQNKGGKTKETPKSENSQAKGEITSEHVDIKGTKIEGSWSICNLRPKYRGIKIIKQPITFYSGDDNWMKTNQQIHQNWKLFTTLTKVLSMHRQTAAVTPDSNDCNHPTVLETKTKTCRACSIWRHLKKCLCSICHEHNPWIIPSPFMLVTPRVCMFP